MKEPLKEEPNWEQNNRGQWYSTGVKVSQIDTTPEVYAIGFENGAYALADLLHELDDVKTIIRVLHKFKMGEAKPVAGWKHAPVRK